MRTARKIIAFASGFLLYSAGVAAAAKMATTGLPRHWYAAMGGRYSLPVMIGEALGIALILFTVAVPWIYLTLRPTRRRQKPYLSWCISGIGLAWVAWLIYGAFYFALQPKTYSQPMASLLLSSSAAPLFGSFNIIGVLCGAWIAGLIAQRVHSRLPRSRSRDSSVGRI
jgi:glucan phosphoethanolaminetransferase (alkaline phosphatase superfamily)